MNLIGSVKEKSKKIPEAAETFTELPPCKTEVYKGINTQPIIFTVNCDFEVQQFLALNASKCLHLTFDVKCVETTSSSSSESDPRVKLRSRSARVLALHMSSLSRPRMVCRQTAAAHELFFTCLHGDSERFSGVFYCLMVVMNVFLQSRCDVAFILTTSFRRHHTLQPKQSFLFAQLCQLQVVINSLWKSHVHICVTASMEQMKFPHQQCLLLPLLCSLIMRNCICVPAWGLAAIIFGSSEEHPLFILFHLKLWNNLGSLFPSYQHIPHLLIASWCSGLTKR